VKVGVLQFFSWPERRVALETVYERAFQRIEVMDRTGYDAVWLAEHHFTGYSVCPSVHLMGMRVAERTRNLRIGMAVSLAAFYHPLRLAEEVALLDVLSGGRVNWGAGRGFDRNEFRNFGVPAEETYPRFRETVEIVLRAWTQERLSYQGEFFEFDGVEVLPKPLQQPHPPTWLAASSPPAIEWAAQHGYSIMMDPHARHAEIARKRELYRTELEKHGHSIEGRDIPMARLLAIGETRDEAEKIARAGAGWLVGSYMSPGKGQVGLGGAGFLEPGDDPVHRYLDGVIVWGTPEEVTEQLMGLREEMFLSYLMCAPLSHRSFTLFTDEVLPSLLDAP
jgi:alkanesulfonate monooxygenase SsuD/methylene tetrahydromethanopterin reductase-like flavin-dependent oxidoreductase (luciferase family)